MSSWSDKLSRSSGGAACGCALLMASTSALAADWEITPRASVEEVYTSNVRLARRGDEESDLVTRLSPGVSIRGRGPSLRVGLDYDPELVLYVNADDLNGLRHNLLGFGSADFFERHLVVDSTAAIVQAFRNPGLGLTGINTVGSGTLPTTTSEVSGSDNLTEVRTFSLSPAWRDRFGDVAETELRYRFGLVMAADDEVSDVLTNTISAFVRNPSTEATRLTWTLSALQEWTETGEGDSGIGTTGGASLDDSSRQRSLARADLGYRITSSFAVLGGVGWEVIEDQSLREEPDGLIWNIGFEYQPRPNSSIRVTYGRRFDEQDIEVSTDWQLGATTRLTVAYRESLENSQLSLLDQTSRIGTDQQGNLIDLTTGLPFQPGERSLGLTNQTFREESFDATLTSTRGRNTFVVLARYDKREAELPSSDKETIAGGGLSWQRRLTRALSFDSQFDYRNIRFDGGLSGKDNLYSISAGLRLSLSESTDLGFRVRQTERDSTEAEREFSETLVSVRLSKTF